MGEFVRVTGIDDVKPGHGIVAEVNGKTLAVFNVDGTFHAIDNTRIYRGGARSLSDIAFVTRRKRCGQMQGRRPGKTGGVFAGIH